MKLIDKINERHGAPFFSFEYFPPKTPAGVANLYERVDRMAQMQPLFVDITWGAGGSTADLTLELSSNFQTVCALETQMHLTCTNMPKEKVVEALDKCKACGIQNIIALRGDPPVGQERWSAVEGGFNHAVDLVKFIREKYGDYFGISVAGYPEGHTECESYEADLQRLKEKVDAGADFIITQMFYDVDNFIKFMKDCKDIGINVPVIPGIMPINGYASWKRMTDFCKTVIPDEMRQRLDAVKDDDEAVKELGVTILTEMCRKLLDNGVLGLHMYTLNLEKSVTQVLHNLNFDKDIAERRTLPWRARLGTKEEVRPIFWANRPKSYMSRTKTWDDFPNGRWGDNRSPAFGELLDYHLFAHAPDVDAKRKLWGTPETQEQVNQVFVDFVEGKIAQLPWCQSLAGETSAILPQVVDMNRRGFLTINSQPRCNAVSSCDPQFGWGGPGGHVYQKAYVEFFCSAADLEKLVALAPKFPSLSYTASNFKGEVKSNAKGTGVTAVTWGVFPDKEIAQPTVVDQESFMVWKDEAYALWMTWKSVYVNGTESCPKADASANLIQKIHDEFWLVDIIDNDFVSGNIFAIFAAAQ